MAVFELLARSFLKVELVSTVNVHQLLCVCVCVANMERNKIICVIDGTETGGKFLRITGWE